MREAIGKYMPPEVFFAQWLPLFTTLLDRPVYFTAVWGALENISHQFNLRPPEGEASPEIIDKYLERGPNFARYVLSFAQNRIEARDHPELLLAMAIFQASHRCFIDNLTNNLETARFRTRLSSADWQTAYAVIDGPFRQFDDFMIFSTLFPLTLHVRAALAAEQPSDAQGYSQITTAAITTAWEIFTKKRIVRRDFEGGGRMICPANQHLRAAKDYRAIEDLFAFVYDHNAEPPIHRLLAKARQEATNGAYFRQSGYWEGLAEAVHRNKDARGGQGLKV